MRVREMKSWMPPLTNSHQQPWSPSMTSCSHFASNWATSKNVSVWSGKDEGVSQCWKESEAHRKVCVLDERPEQAARRLCCDVRKAIDRPAAKLEAPQADGWGVLMEPRLAFVSARVCGRGALHGLAMQVSWWSYWNRALQHLSTNCKCIDGSGK